MKKRTKESVAILGCGEIGSAVAKICKEAGYLVCVRELKYDQLKDKNFDYLHVSIPQLNKNKFIKTVVNTIKEISPKLTVINSSTTPGVTREIFKKTKVPIIHSLVIGLHPQLYESIRYYFPKVIAPVNEKSLKLAKEHFRRLGLKTLIYNSPEESEAAKLLDLTYYAWNIIFCKWVKEVCDQNGWDFDNVYTKHNKMYNRGYVKLLPNVVRPVLIPHRGKIGGHCTIPDVKLFEKLFPNRFTKFILKENQRYAKEVVDEKRAREDYIKVRNKMAKRWSRGKKP